MSLAEGAKRSRTVLVVDDQADTRNSLTVFLRYSIRDIEVRSAASAMEALDLLRRERVHLVVADYRMPGMDGLKFLDAVGRVAPGVPRILFTAHHDDPNLGAEGRVERLVPKTAALEELVEGVQGLLEPGGPASPLG